MEQEILKNSFPAPEWFMEELRKEIKINKQLMEKEKVSETIIESSLNRPKLSDIEKRIAVEELRIEMKRNPKLESLISMANSYNDYLWQKLRYENWQSYGVEDHLRYDPITRMILVLKSNREKNPFQGFMEEMFHKKL